MGQSLSFRRVLVLAFCILGIQACEWRSRPGDEIEETRRGDQALSGGDYPLARSHYDKAIRINAKYARPYHGRGVAYLHEEKYEQAIASLSEAIVLDPKDDAAVFDRGLAYWHHGDSKLALMDYEQAVLMNPKNDNACNGVAWALATSPNAEIRDGKKAIEIATRACELTEWKNPFHLSTLAAAYAESGDFAKALEWHRKAMSSPDFPPDRMERAKQRLRLYEQGKPFRESNEKKKPKQ